MSPAITRTDILREENEQGCFCICAEHHPHIGVYLEAFTLRDGIMLGAELKILIPSESLESLNSFLADCAILEDLDEEAESVDKEAEGLSTVQ